MYIPHIVCCFMCWWTLGHFQLSSIVNNAAVNFVHWCTSICFSPVFNSFESTPWSSIAGSCGNPAFKYLRNCQTDFHSKCAILHSHLKVLGFQFLCILTRTCYFSCFVFVLIVAIQCVWNDISLWFEFTFS